MLKWRKVALKLLELRVFSEQFEAKICSLTLTKHCFCFLGEYRALFPDDHANLSRPCYSFDSKANLSHGRESRYPRDRCVSLDCMAGFSECAHQITAHLASLTADNPELKGIQTTLLTHVQHVFKRNFLGHNDCPTYAPSGEHSAHVHRSKPSFAETPTISALDESGELGKTNISKESGKTVSEDDRPPFDTTEGFRPYKKTSNHLSSDQRDVLDERKLPHDKDRKATSSTSKGFPEMLEQLRRRLTATSCSSAQKLSGSVQCKQTTSAISTGIPTNHSFAHEVMQASFPDIDLRPYETSHATSGCFKSTIAKHEQYKLNSWQNLRHARVRKPSVPLTTQHAVRPTWFILPPLHQSGLSPGVEGPLPAAIRDLVPLQMALSLPSPLAFDSALYQPGGHWSRGIK